MPVSLWYEKRLLSMQIISDIEKHEEKNLLIFPHFKQMQKASFHQHNFFFTGKKTCKKWWFYLHSFSCGKINVDRSNKNHALITKEHSLSETK